MPWLRCFSSSSPSSSSTSSSLLIELLFRDIRYHYQFFFRKKTEFVYQEVFVGQILNILWFCLLFLPFLKFNKFRVLFNSTHREIKTCYLSLIYVHWKLILSDMDYHLSASSISLSVLRILKVTTWTVKNYFKTETTFKSTCTCRLLSFCLFFQQQCCFYMFESIICSLFDE